ncbi:hypothetical protein Tco_0799842 [Tanacetum coccineum]|uniref:Reverse transcriptase domain-containing protein n=1 Tax=Tanacetum coccineum TaxID=301880 RepID=A0ABQ4ZRF5_9ASTR
MLQRFKDANLVLTWEICHFMVKKGIVLRHKVSGVGLEVDKAKIDVTTKLPPHTNVKSIRNFLGHAELDIEIKDKKGIENVAVDHLSRIDNDETSDDNDVDNNFPGETRMEITTNDTPWFADFANYLVGDVIPKGTRYDLYGRVWIYSYWSITLSTKQESSIRTEKRTTCTTKNCLRSDSDINYYRHFLDILENYNPMDDEPKWAADRVVAPTSCSAITIPETANEFAIKGNHLTLVKGNQFDGRIKTDPHKHIHEFLEIYDMFKNKDTENEAVRLMMFPLSLTGEEKTWLNELNEGTIET